MLFAEIVTLLARARVACALAGAGALAVHGVSRSTFDLDLFTADRSVLEPGMWTTLEGAEVDLRRGDADDPLAGVVRCSRHGDRPVDVVVGRSRWQAEAVARAMPATYLGVTLPVLQPADLVLLKVYAGGTQDQLDVRLLLHAGHREALIADVDARVMPLPAEMRQRWLDWQSNRPGD